MTEKDEFFKSEEVEEQIDLLEQWPDHREETNPQAARVISHLRQFYATGSTKYTPNLERAWQRIVDERLLVTQSSQEKGHLIIMQEQQEERKNRQNVRNKRTNKRTFVQWLSILAAVMVVGIVVGSAILVLHTAQHMQSAQITPKAKISSITGSGGTPIPKSPHPITGGKCTIDTTVTHPQQSTSNLPGLYIFSFNSEQGDNILYRYDPSTKKVVWSKKLCSSFESSGTLEQNGILYLTGSDTTNTGTSGSVSYLYALNETDGSAIWGVQFPTKVVSVAIPPRFMTNHKPSPMDFGFVEAPTIANGIAYVMQRSGMVYALDATTGSQLWTFDTGRNALATTSTGGGSIVEPSSIQVINGVAYGSIVDRFFALNAKSGTQLWMHSFNNKLNINQNLALANGTIYLTADVPGYGTVMHPDTYIYAFDAQTGSQKWVSVKMSGYINGPTVLNDKVNVMSYDGIWYTLNSSTGALESQMQLANVGVSAPLLINGVLYSITDTTLAVLNPDGSAKWSVAMTSAYPFIDDVQGGIIYVTGRGTGIYAYSVTDGSLLWHYDGYLPQPQGIVTASIVS